MVCKLFDKKIESRMSAKKKKKKKKKLAEELHKTLIKEFKRRKFLLIFKDNILAADLAEMRSMSSKNQNVKYLLCVIDVFTK